MDRNGAKLVAGAIRQAAWIMEALGGALDDWFGWEEAAVACDEAVCAILAVAETCSRRSGEFRETWDAQQGGGTGA